MGSFPLGHADVGSGRYFLGRDGEFASNMIREFHRLELSKIITSNPHSSSSVIREQDLNNAMLRASVGTAAENHLTIEKLAWKMDNGPLRPIMPSLTASKSRAGPSAANLYSEGSQRDLFASSILGTPLSLTMKTEWPLDLFVTPPIHSAYSEIHAFLMAFRDTHLRVLDCWSSLSSSQRRRRKWTGANEGGSSGEMSKRRALARATWGSVRAMLFFLDQLESHFTTDVIDVQHTGLLDALGHTSPKLGLSMRGSKPVQSSSTSPGEADFVDFLSLRYVQTQPVELIYPTDKCTPVIFRASARGSCLQIDRQRP